jgi:hypothetical protein
MRERVPAITVLLLVSVNDQGRPVPIHPELPKA